MPVRVNAIANCDDAVIFWRVEKRIPNCLGFAIERERKLSDGSVRRTILDNRVGFASDNPKPGQFHPSTKWPFQRFSWADHSVNSGDRARYRVAPMLPGASGQIEQHIAERSPWTPWLILTGDTGDSTSTFFNRGLVISQFMSRYLDDLQKREGLPDRAAALRKLKSDLGKHETPIRRFLAGSLRDEMLRILGDARKRRLRVYGALYELEDDELITALAALGSRARIVLANGSITKKKGQSAAEARKGDQNRKARRLLKSKGAQVHDRMVSPGALGHNKFLVVTDANDKPLAAWTGSTNWTRTGLCTQINNGVLIANREIARVYFDQWERLRAAKSAFPAALVNNNKARKLAWGSSRADVWFTRTNGKVDLTALEDVVAGAKKAILFLMFQPGGKGTLAAIQRKLSSPGKLYIKGVVSTLPAKSPDDAEHVDVNVFGDGEKHPVGLDIVQPQGIKAPFASWAATVTRGEFLSNMGFAIVHSKVIVVDPFTHPVVVTGSHNFSSAASGKNDENFLVIRGNRTLAAAYAAHILAVYQHYRWLAFVYSMQGRGENPTARLTDDDSWQARHWTAPSRKEIEFWTPG
jgi:phosphatidylserine/phosphatidylglycerophosphate/cardiolipin synthase-like enzyme